MNYVKDIENQLNIVMVLLRQFAEPGGSYMVDACCSHQTTRARYLSSAEAEYWANRLHRAGASGRIEIINPNGCTTHIFERELQPALED